MGWNEPHTAEAELLVTSEVTQILQLSPVILLVLTLAVSHCSGTLHAFL